MKLDLSSKQRRALRAIASASDHRQLARRARAVLAVAEGHPIAAVARAVRASRPTVYRWVDLYRAGGVASLPPPARARAPSHP